jgi:hypothetical protein
MALSEKENPGDVLCAETVELSAPNVRPLPSPLSTMSRQQLAKLEKDLVRKIDLRLMPAVIVMYLLNYIDRNNIASARLGGLEKDLGLKGSEYQTCQ